MATTLTPDSDRMGAIAKAEKLELELEKAKREILAIQKESTALGKIKAADCNIAFNKLLKYAVIFEIKKNKDYRKGGMTWTDFCRSIGEADRTVERTLKDLRPIYDELSDKIYDFLGMSFNKARHLGRSISDGTSSIEDGTLIIDGAKIPIAPENTDEIEAAIDALKDSHRREKEELQGKVKKLKRRVKNVENEEINGLRTERDALVKENVRLKKFDPEDGTDHTKQVEQLTEIHKALATPMALIRIFMNDDFVSEDRQLQAQASAAIMAMQDALSDLYHDYVERFRPPDV